VEAEHDAQNNARRLLALLKAVADGATGVEAVAASLNSREGQGISGIETPALTR